MKKKLFFKGKGFYTLLAAFGVLTLLLVCSAYFICYTALKNASRQLETSLETILSLQVQNIGETHSTDLYSDLEAELGENEILLELASGETFEYGEAAEEAESLLLEYKESVSYGDLECYLFFENSSYLMSTALTGENAVDQTSEYVTEHLADFESMEPGDKAKYLGTDTDGVYYDVCLNKIASGIGLIRVNVGSPSYELPELFLSNMSGVEMYTYDQYGNVHALEGGGVLAELYDYESLGEADTDTFTFSSGVHSYIGSYYTFTSRAIRLAVFCRDTAAENRIISSRILLIAVIALALVCLALAVLFARWTYQPIDELVSRVSDEEESGERFRDDYAIINRAFDLWAEQLRERDRLIQNHEDAVPDSAQLQSLSEEISSLSKEEALEEYDSLIQQMTSLSGSAPAADDMAFSLLANTIAMTVMDFSLPGDISRQTVYGYAQTILHARDAAQLRRTLEKTLDSLKLRENPKENRTCDGKRFEEIREYVCQNFKDPNLSEGQVAEHFQISRSALSRQFKKYNKTGFLEYVHQLRVAEAVKYLLETDKTQAEIAELCGYTNIYTMHRAFKTYANTTPGKIREQKQ